MYIPGHKSNDDLHIIVFNFSVSPCPQPTNIDSVNTRNNTDSGGSSSDVAAIASVVVLIFLLALLIIPLAVGIVLYRRWKVEQLRKSLHPTHPPAPLAMGMKKLFE